MSTLRQRIAQRLVQAQHTAAILTTFNEIDMGACMDLRKKFKEEFEKNHGVKLGFMSAFVRVSLHMHLCPLSAFSFSSFVLIVIKNIVETVYLM